MSAPASIWIDGRAQKLDESTVAFELRGEPRVTRRFGMPRVEVVGSLQMPGIGGRVLSRRVQILVERGGPAYVGFHCTRKEHRFEGMFFSIEPDAAEPSTEPSWMADQECALALDGHRCDDEISDLRVHVLEPGSAPSQRCRSLLQVRLQPGLYPTRWLGMLCQPRPGRRVVVAGRERGQPRFLCFDGLEVARASVVAARDQLLKPAPEGLVLEFVIDARIHHDNNRDLEPMLPVTAADLPVWRGRKGASYLTETSQPALHHMLGFLVPRSEWDRATGRADDGLQMLMRLVAATRARDRATGLTRIPAPLWLERALDRRSAFGPIARELARLVDAGERGGPSHAWLVFGDLLRERGFEAKADALAAAMEGRFEPVMLQACSSEAELALFAAIQQPGGRCELGNREWTPRLWGAHWGPFLTHLVVEPGWRCDASDSHDLGWHTRPGLLGYPELELMFELPCCALLSRRRVLLAGDGPPDRSREWLGRNLSYFSDIVCETIGLSLAGLDLRGLRARGLALDGTDLRGANLSEAEFRDCSLRYVDLHDAKLDNTVFERVDGQGDGMFAEIPDDYATDLYWYMLVRGALD